MAGWAQHTHTRTYVCVSGCACSWACVCVRVCVCLHFSSHIVNILTASLLPLPFVLAIVFHTVSHLCPISLPSSPALSWLLVIVVGAVRHLLPAVILVFVTWPASFALAFGYIALSGFKLTFTFARASLPRLLPPVSCCLLPVAWGTVGPSPCRGDIRAKLPL